MKTTSPHPRQEPEMASCFVMTYPITLGLPDIAQCLSSANKLYTTDRRLPLTRGDLRHLLRYEQYIWTCTLCTMLSKSRVNWPELSSLFFLSINVGLMAYTKNVFCLLSFANYDIAIVAFFSIGMSYPNAEQRNMTIDGKGEKLKLKVAV